MNSMSTTSAFKLLVIKTLKSLFHLYYIVNKTLFHLYAIIIKTLLKSLILFYAIVMKSHSTTSASHFLLSTARLVTELHLAFKPRRLVLLLILLLNLLRVKLYSMTLISNTRLVTELHHAFKPFQQLFFMKSHSTTSDSHFLLPSL